MNDFTSQIAAMQAVVVGQALQDPAFRTELLGNPRATVEKVFKVALPPHIQIQVNEAPANTVVVTLPHKAEVGLSGELSDDDLEAVAGGSKAEADAFFKGVGSVGLAVVVPHSGAGGVGRFTSQGLGQVITERASEICGPQ